MAPLATPMARVRRYLCTTRLDSLARNSLYMMMTTVVTAGLGYVFWIVAAHLFTSAQVGIGSGVISMCSTLALLTNLGPWAMLIERLHEYERSRTWTTYLARTCAATAVLTALTAAVAVPLIARSRSYSSFFVTPWAVLLAVLGSAAWTVVSLFGAAFIAARRADGMLSTQTLVSVAKMMLLFPLAATGAGATGIVMAWIVSTLLGIIAGAAWLLPRLGLGRGARKGASQHVAREGAGRYGTDSGGLRRYRAARHRQVAGPNAATLRHLLGQHITSAGGALTPLVLPVLVVVRLGVIPNAYFYITWMVGGVFFMVSPSVSAALFAEGVREGTDLAAIVRRAFRITSLLLFPAMVAMIAGGKLILGIFGSTYATAGYGLLVLLAISAVPDTISNIAVAVFRVTKRLNYSASLNVGMLAATLIGAWFLMPPLGIAGAGVAWLGAQAAGAIASLPAYAHLGRKAT